MRYKKGKKYLVTHTQELVYFGGDKRGNTKIFEDAENKYNLIVVFTKNIVKEIIK